MAAGIVTALNGVLGKYSYYRKVYKRTAARTGGDALIGRAGKVTYTDVLFSPQPYGGRLGINVTAYGLRDNAEPVVSSRGPLESLDQYEFMFSASATTEAELRNSDVSLVLKDSQGNEELLTIVDAQATYVSGQPVSITVYARSA